MRRRESRLRPALAGALAAALCGCTPSISDRNLQMVDVREAIDLVDGHKKLLGLAGSATGTWVDPRSARAYRMGHIPGAVSLPFQDVESGYKELTKYDVVVVYGDTYNDPLADGMSKRLMDLGLGDVRTLHGGLQAWKKDDRELVTGDAPH